MNEINFNKVLCEENVDLSDKMFESKDELFRYMAKLFEKNGFINDVEKYVDSLYEREAMGTTYMENGLVLPHGRSESVTKAGVAICRFKPMKYDEGSDKKADIAITLAIPKSIESNQYIKMLASVSCSLLEKKVMDLIKYGNDPKEIVTAMREVVCKQ